jgi:uncharacterized protein YxeA
MLKDIKNTLIIVVILLITVIGGFLLLKPKYETKTKIPVKTKITTPKITRVTDTIYITDTLYKYRVKYVSEGYDEDLIDKYTKLQDSIEKLQMYVKAVEKITYTTTFSDSIQNITVSSNVRGALLKQNVSYEIFPKTYTSDTIIEHHEKNKIKLFGHGSFGIPIRAGPNDNHLTVKADLILKNRRDQLLSLGLDTDFKLWLGFGVKF